MSDIVDMNGAPVDAGSIRQQHHIPAELAVRLREVGVHKLFGYLESVLPVDEPEFHARFVLDRDGWLQEVIGRLQAEIGCTE